MTPRLTAEQRAALETNEEYQASLAAIREGLADFEAGRCQSMDEFFAEFDRDHGIVT